MNNLNRCFIIAELSANHGNDIEVAKQTIRAAKRAGADAVKFQTYTAETITLDVRNELFKITSGTHWDGQYLFDLYRDASLSWDWHKELFEIANQEGLICFSSPFDHSAVDFLESLNTPIYKIASFEITDIPLIKYVALKGKPVIISTGIASLEDIELAVATCREVGNNQLVLLKCTSEYPASPEDANLATMKDMAERFNLPVGLSDHTAGVECSMLAVALGAKVIEKHIILDKSIGGPDAHFSLDVDEFTNLTKTIRLAEQIIGKVDYDLTPKKVNSRKFARSLFVTENVEEGEYFTNLNVRSIRPGMGLHPKFLEKIIGQRSSRSIVKGEPFELNMIVSK